jgi:hypothetical protein
MKRTLTIMVGAVIAILLIPSVALACSQTEVGGVISYNGTPADKNVNVTVTCDKTTLTDETNRFGAYQVQFTQKDCSKDSKVTVSATVDGVKGSTTGTVTKGDNVINLAIVKVNTVPELGLITGFTAAALGGGAFLGIRSRNLSEKKA